MSIKDDYKKIYEIDFEDIGKYVEETTEKVDNFLENFTMKSDSEKSNKNVIQEKFLKFYKDLGKFLDDI